ncbi:MAG: RluA family pseudouridine synthase [Gammaproteobacteria bacterium]|nr:RluA family pseudouridine synthase [Gammaproteobacteria bacterium]
MYPTKTPVSILSVAPSFYNQRLDNFLKSRLKGLPKSALYRLIRTGQVRVNKKRVKPSYHLAEGDEVRLPPLSLPEPSTIPEIPPRVLQLFQASILHKDENILVINKPSGFAVQGGSGLAYSIIDIIRKMISENTSLELVHRLDKDSSGCLLFACKRSVLKYLHEQFVHGTVQKIYLALLKGHCSFKHKNVELPLFKSQLVSGERMVCVKKEGKMAHTTFTPINVYKETTLVEVRPHTGRTHQIRVHAQAIGHAIAGDEKYGDKKFNQHMRQYGLARLFLHAHQIAFKLPDKKKVMNITAPLPEELKKCLVRLLAPLLPTPPTTNH